MRINLSICESILSSPYQYLSIHLLPHFLHLVKKLINSYHLVLVQVLLHFKHFIILFSTFNNKYRTNTLICRLFQLLLTFRYIKKSQSVSTTFESTTSLTCSMNYVIFRRVILFSKSLSFLVEDFCLVAHPNLSLTSAKIKPKKFWE